MSRRRSTAKHDRRQAGMTLIELLVALAIGTFLMIGAVTVFMQGRAAFRVIESLARLQENSRFALDALERDIRMAQYWGLTNRSELIGGRATEAPIATEGALSRCGRSWVIDLDHAIAGTNNRYEWECAEPKARDGSDTVVVRRVAANPLTAAQVNAAPAGTLFVRSTRGGAHGEIFSGATPVVFETMTQ